MSIPGTHVFSRNRLIAAALALTVAAVVAAVAFSIPTDAGAKGSKPKSGNYSGKTAQKLPVSFTVKNGKVKKAQWTVGAGICEGTKFQTSKSVKVNKKGKFSIREDNSKLTGKFVSKKKVKGKARVDFSTNPACPSVIATSKYTARRR